MIEAGGKDWHFAISIPETRWTKWIGVRGHLREWRYASQLAEEDDDMTGGTWTWRPHVMIGVSQLGVGSRIWSSAMGWRIWE